MAKFQSTKTYGTDRGLSCCFRQWKASHSHCSTLHGYSLGFKFVFESETLDSRNWAFDFGGMKPIKQYLDSMFDHTVLVAEDDPALEFFKAMANYSTMPEHNGVNENIGYLNPIPHEEGRICALRIVPGVGCEMTAKMVFDEATKMLDQMKSGENSRYEINPDVRLVSVECFEHGSNSAIYYGDERRVHYVDVEVEGVDPADLQYFREKLALAMKSGDKITTARAQQHLDLLIDSSPDTPAKLGDLGKFEDVIYDLHKIPPVDEK